MLIAMDSPLLTARISFFKLIYTDWFPLIHKTRPCMPLVFSSSCLCGQKQWPQPPRNTRTPTGAARPTPPPPLTVRPELELQKLVSELALVPHIVAQIEITGQSHFSPQKARRRLGQRATRRLAVTSVAQDDCVTAGPLLRPLGRLEGSGEGGWVFQSWKRTGKRLQWLKFRVAGDRSVLFSKISKLYYTSKARKHGSRITFFIRWELVCKTHSFSGLILAAFWVRHYSPLAGGMSKAKTRSGNVSPEYYSAS